MSEIDIAIEQLLFERTLGLVDIANSCDDVKKDHIQAYVNNIAAYLYHPLLLFRS